MNFSGKADFGIDGDDIGQRLELMAAIVVERPNRRERSRTGIFHPAETWSVRLRGYENRVEEAGAREAIAGQVLQTDSERKHGDQRRHADGDSDRCKRIAQRRLAKIARGQFRQVAALHDTLPSLTSLPSPIRIKR